MIEVIEFPNHWDVRPVWALFRRSKTIGFPDMELLSVYRDHGVVPKSSRDDNHNVASEDLTSYQLVQPGDLVVNKMKAWQGSFAISDFKGIVSPAYFVYKAKHKENSKFLHYLLRSTAYLAHYNRISSGVRIGQWDLDPAKFNVTGIGIPPRAEQDAIVAFLDREIESIDLLSGKLMELQKLFSARFESSLNEEFSKMIGSGIPIRYLAKHLDVRDSNADFPLMSVSKIYGVISRSEITDKVARAESLDNYKICKPGDLVINRMSANTGALGVASQAGRVSPDYMVLEFFQRYDQALVEHLFKSSKMRSEMSSRVRGIGTIESVGVRTPRLTWSNLADIRIDFPSSEDQAALSQKISDRKRQSDQLLEKTEHVIHALRSRKASLINAAVTGKINALGGKNG